MVRKVGDWAKVARITKTMRDRYERAVRQALMREAHFLRGKMIEGIAQQAPGGLGFAPLSPITLAMRRARGFAGTKALIVTGTLRRSITVVHERGGTGLGGAVFVGVHRQAKTKGGKPLVNIAKVHEFGKTWTQPMSPKARRFLFAILNKYGPKGPAGRDNKGRFTKGKFQSRGGGRKDGMVTFHIPARPFIRPVMGKHAQPRDVKRRFLDNLLKGMGGDFKLIGGG